MRDFSPYRQGSIVIFPLDPVHCYTKVVTSNNAYMMFVKDFTEIDMPVTAVLAHLRGQPQSILKNCVEHASQAGVRLLGTLPLDLPRLDTITYSEIAVSEIVENDNGFVIPVALRDAHLPHLDFDLEFFPMGDQMTRANLTAFYDVSSFLLATPLDKRLMQSVAESAARAFLSCMSATVTTAAAKEAHSTS